MKISVIIPVYNVEKYLEKCVESVTNQTLKNIEIILVDDGSPDSCPQICDSLADKDTRIKVIHKTNGGLSSARNAGLKMAKGEWIYFLDSDDYIEPQTLEIMLSFTKNKSIDIVIAGVQPFYNGTTKPSVFDSMVQYFSRYETIKKINTKQIIKLPAVACGKLYKKSIIDKYNIQFDNRLINEDEAWSWYYNTKIKNGIYLPNKFYKYLIREDSIVGNKQNNGKKLGDILLIIEKVHTHMNEHNLIKKFKRPLFGWTQHLIRTTMETAKRFNYQEIVQKCIDFSHKYGAVQYTFWEQIFSIKHTWDRTAKIVCIFGIKFKLK